MSDAGNKENPKCRTAIDLQGMNGLSVAEARQRLGTAGPNELPSEKPRGMLAIAFEVVREPMFLMLVAAGSLYLIMGDPADAAMLLGFVLVVMAITIIQERRTERALDALRDLSCLANMFSATFGTNINRRLGDIVSGFPCEVERDEPSILGGMYRVILLRNPAENLEEP